ncbi:hypothetical protein BRC99_02590 [Halobacteriales archaeon QS_7_69_60]|nr:MAG: hypothetical protein BRC99_02590 [Halobacteriales archaeon QS_7_69_60]
MYVDPPAVVGREPTDGAVRHCTGDREEGDRDDPRRLRVPVAVAIHHIEYASDDSDTRPVARELDRRFDAHRVEPRPRRCRDRAHPVDREFGERFEFADRTFADDCQEQSTQYEAQYRGERPHRGGDSILGSIDRPHLRNLSASTHMDFVRCADPTTPPSARRPAA